MIVYDRNLKIFYSTKINDQNYFSGFGTKELGDGRKPETILNFFKKLNSSFDNLVLLEQIHSTNVEVYEKEIGGEVEKIADCDGVLTKKNNCLLTVHTADCLPMIFVDKDHGLIGFSHQGWRGSLKKLAQKMVSKMIEFGASLDKIVVAIGPGIGACCYDITDDRYYEFLEEFNGYSGEIFQFRGGRHHVDLTRLNFLLLREIGLKKDKIDFFPFCTKCDQSRFFSFRRDKKSSYAEMFHFVIKTDKPRLFTNLN